MVFEPALDARPDEAEPLEESPEAFVARWRGYAADAELFARPEGVPLVECRVGDAVIQVFERTGPYLSRPGRARLIVNPTADAVSVADPARRPGVESLGLSRLAATGRVVRRDGPVIVVDAGGVPLVVGLTAAPPPEVREGALVTFESQAPVHGFVVDAEGLLAPRRETVDDTN